MNEAMNYEQVTEDIFACIGRRLDAKKNSTYLNSGKKFNEQKVFSIFKNSPPFRGWAIFKNNREHPARLSAPPRNCSCNSKENGRVSRCTRRSRVFSI